MSLAYLGNRKDSGMVETKWRRMQGVITLERSTGARSQRDFKAMIIN